MDDALASIHRWWRYAHIVAGFVGLIVFWLPIFARKGKALHTGAGRVFAVCAWVVAVTALGSSISALAWPEAFGATSESSKEAILSIRALFGALLGFLGLTLMQALYLGLRAIRTKSAPQQANGAARSLTVTLALWSVGMAAFGTYLLTQPSLRGLAGVLIVLGGVGLFSSRSDWRFLHQPNPPRMGWWYKHMECLIGCGVAFHTAFLVFGMNRLLGMNAFAGSWALVGWFLPVAVGAPAAHIWIRYYRRRFDGPDGTL